jgi:hypothetical protein
MAGERLAQADLSPTVRSLRTACAAWLLSAVLAGVSALARAQGGPPLVTDDPDTPGDGRWEINLATIATRTPGRWSLALPDADLNYGWGDRVQLTAQIPWAVVQSGDGGWNSGLGNAQLGVKWRFLDRQDLGLTMSTFPQFTWAWVESSKRRGVADAGHQLLLPLESAVKLDEFALDAEIARNVVAGAASQWQFGAIAQHGCGGGADCMLELRQRVGGGDTQTLINLGVHWKLGESLALIAAAGGEFGSASTDQQQALLYLGVQILR